MTWGSTLIVLHAFIGCFVCFTETVDNYHTNSMNMQNVSSSNRISEEVNVHQSKSQPIESSQRTQPQQAQQQESDAPRSSHPQQSTADQKHTNEMKRESEGIATANHLPN